MFQPVYVRSAVGQEGQLRPDLIHQVQIQLHKPDFFAFFHLGHNPPPGICDDGVAPGMVAGLHVSGRRGGDAEHLIVHRPLPEQQLPMGQWSC